MRRLDLLLRLCAVPALVTAGCAGDASDTADLEDRPFDDRSNELIRGVYDCTERSDTGYSQGNAFAISVVTVDGKPAEVSTANAYIALQERADADGIRLRIVSGFRTMEQQEYLYGCYVNCSCNNCNLAARPGYSNHQSGHALDLNTSDPGVYDWLQDNGPALGWERTVPSEDWHWEWWGDPASYPGPCGAPPVPSACASGSYAGAFCDDDGDASEAAADCLATTLGVDLSCGLVEGHPAFCASDHATRADAVFAFATAAGMPLVDAQGAPFPDAFVDDDGHAREAVLNAAYAFGVLRGDGQGHANPDGVASRSTLAVLLARLYALPASTTDAFSDDDGSANEDAHDRTAAAGLAAGCGPDDAGRARYCGADAAARADVAAFACRAGAAALPPVWALDPGTPPPPPDDDGVDVAPPPGIDAEIPPEDDPAAPVFVDLPTSVVDDGCAATPGGSALVGAALLLWRRRRRARSAGRAERA